MNQARSHVSYKKSDIGYSTYIPTVYLHIAYVDKHKNKLCEVWPTDAVEFLDRFYIIYMYCII